MRTLTLLLLMGVVPAQAQVLDQKIYFCNLTVNDIRVSWPPFALSERDCAELKDQLEKKDKTKARIQCECSVGDRI